MASARITRKRVRWRRCLVERLETRRLLIGEGEVFAVEEPFDASGLVGSLESIVRWGDGSESQGTVIGQVDNNGPLSIRFVPLDEFFNDPDRMLALTNAANSIIKRFDDDLDAITPGGILTWSAVTDHPLRDGNCVVVNGTPNGACLVMEDLTVAANELVIYVGSRDLPGNTLGEAGPGFYAAQVAYDTPQERAQVLEFLDTVQHRGEAGSRLPQPTDVGVWGGTITFDSNTNWHFGLTTEGLEDDEFDFMSVAAHELMHVLGFGSVAAPSSFTTYSTNQSFIGPAAVDLFGGNVPLENRQHIAPDVLSRGQTPLIGPMIDRGERSTATPLDFATLDDLGWDLRPAPTVTVTANHTYADNPPTSSDYPVEVVLRGTAFGEITQSISATVTNTPPVLTTIANQTVQLGDAVTSQAIGTIQDSGAEHLFEYSIDWGDGSPTDQGSITVDPVAGALLSFPGSHTYQAPGIYQVVMTAEDDDGGVSDNATFTVTVTMPPALSLAVSSPGVTEDSDTVTLTISQIPAIGVDREINLSSSDLSEATIPGSATILAGQSSVTVPIAIVDDTLLDGTQVVTFTATAVASDPSEVSLNVFDAETIDAVFSADQVVEGDSSVSLRIARSNTDISSPLSVNISGGNPSLIALPTSVEIPAGMPFLDVDLQAVDNSSPQPSVMLRYTIDAAGYQAGSASIVLEDDEPPKFQNPSSPGDVNDSNGVNPLDAILIINYVATNGFVEIDPASELEYFLDVSGDYRVNALDAILVINMIAAQSSLQSEYVASETLAASSDFLQLKEDDELETSIQFAV